MTCAIIQYVSYSRLQYITGGEGCAFAGLCCEFYWHTHGKKEGPIGPEYRSIPLLYSITSMCHVYSVLYSTVVYSLWYSSLLYPVVQNFYTYCTILYSKWNWGARIKQCPNDLENWWNSHYCVDTTISCINAENVLYRTVLFSSFHLFWLCMDNVCTSTVVSYRFSTVVDKSTVWIS